MESVDIISLTLQVLIAGTVGIGVTFVRSLATSYSAKKGGNLADKEDIADITREIERTKQQFSDLTERLRSDLTRAINVHKALYETELEVYKEIWEKLIDLRYAVELLASYLDKPAELSGRIVANDELLPNFSKAFESLGLTMNARQPFYSQEVYDELISIIIWSRSYASEVKSYEPTVQNMPEKQTSLSNRRFELFSLIDKVCKAIRTRLNLVQTSITTVNAA